MTAEKIKEICKAYGWKIGDLTKILNVMPSTITRWMKKKHVPAGASEIVLEALYAAIPFISDERRVQLGGQLRLGLGAFLFNGLIQIHMDQAALQDFEAEMVNPSPPNEALKQMGLPTIDPSESSTAVMHTAHGALRGVKERVLVTRERLSELEALEKSLQPEPLAPRRCPSPITCEHANEVPARCPCYRDCYCKRNTCHRVETNP